MVVLRLALKNLRRNPRRVILSMAAVVAGIGVFILGEGFISGLEQNIVVAAEDGFVGHLLARPTGYPTEGLQHPVDRLLKLDDQARKFLDENTVAWTERLLFAPTVSSGADWLRVRAIGYDPAQDPKVFPRKLWKIDGAMPAPKGDEVGVSPSVARLLGLKLGSRMVLQVRTHKGAINALDVTVSAIVTTRNAALDTMDIWVPWDLATRLVRSDEPSHVAVRLKSRELAEAFRPRLQAALGSQAEVVTWHDETKDLLRLMTLRRKAINFIVFILLALAAFGMANTILMAAHERVREVGTLRAMGMTQRGVLGLFLVEGAFMGLVGSILGALWGGGLVRWWASNPLDFSKMLEQEFGGLSIGAFVYTSFSWPVIWGAVFFGTVVAILASIYPARLASRMAPADAVRAD